MRSLLERRAHLFIRCDIKNKEKRLQGLHYKSYRLRSRDWSTSYCNCNNEMLMGQIKNVINFNIKWWLFVSHHFCFPFLVGQSLKGFWKNCTSGLLKYDARDKYQYIGFWEHGWDCCGHRTPAGRARRCFGPVVSALLLLSYRYANLTRSYSSVENKKRGTFPWIS